MKPLARRRWALQSATGWIGITKSGFAGGSGMVVTPLLAMVIPAKETIALVLPLLFLSDIVNFRLYWGAWDWRVVALLLPGAVVGILIATRALVRLPEYWVKKTIGLLALTFIPLQIARMLFWQNLQPAAFDSAWMIALGIVAGLLTGFFSTMAHLGGLITTLYFLFVLPPESINVSMVATATVLYFCINGVKLITYGQSGIINRDILRQIPPLLPALIVGLLVGKRVNVFLGGERVNYFVYTVLVIVAVMAVKLLRAPRPVEPAIADAAEAARSSG